MFHDQEEAYNFRISCRRYYQSIGTEYNSIMNYHIWVRVGILTIEPLNLDNSSIPLANYNYFHCISLQPLIASTSYEASSQYLSATCGNGRADWHNVLNNCRHCPNLHFPLTLKLIHTFVTAFPQCCWTVCFQLQSHIRKVQGAYWQVPITSSKIEDIAVNEQSAKAEDRKHFFCIIWKTVDWCCL